MGLKRSAVIEINSITDMDKKEDSFSIKESKEVNKNNSKEDNTSLNKRKRVWEIDFLRGIVIILMVLDHSMWFIYDFTYKYFDCNISFINGSYVSFPNDNGVVANNFILGYMNAAEWYYNLPLRWAIRSIILIVFFMLSGISFHFSKNNLKRGLMLLGFGGIITILTYTLSYIGILNFQTSAISFGVISCYGGVILIGCLLKWITNKFSKENSNNIFYIISFFLILLSLFLIELYARYKIDVPVNQYDFLSVLNGFIGNILGYSNFGGDYFPIFPYLAYFLIGIIVGETIYKDKKSLFKKEFKVFKPINYIGSHTLWIYVFHVPCIILFNCIIFWSSGFNLSIF